MVAEVVVVAALVAKIASIIGFFENIATIYAWLKKVASTKWKKELDKYIKYLRTVKKLTRRYKHSNRSETLITEALQQLDEELEESRSKVDKWMQKKKLRADDFIKELKSSRATIAEHLQVLWFAVQEEAEKRKSQRKKERKRKKKREEKEKEREYKAELSKNVTKLTASWTRYKERATNSKLDPAKKERLFRKHMEGLREAAKKRESQREKEKEREKKKEEKKREETEYKAWLSKNVTKLTDSWTRYKERATNSKLDSEKKEILFRKHMEGLREKYLREYRQLLKNFIKPESENKYLTSWSAAERLLQEHQRFHQFPEREREREWISHVKEISKKRHKTK